MNQLQKYFSPILRTREQILADIRENPVQYRLFRSWTSIQQENFLDICTGAKGMRILSDAFFKEVMSPEYDKRRLESFLGTLLGKKVKIVQILPNDNTRIADEVALLVTDIVVELEDGSLANIEVQKVPYSFPAGRCACYSSDLLLRQYKRIRERCKNSTFSYRNIKNVYLIVLYETSPQELKQMPHQYAHHAKQVFDSGLELDMLQEYILISLDIFMENMQNKTIETLMEAWLMFLGCDEPDRIMELIGKYPEFEAMYRTLYQICLSTERVMSMFSEELHELDRNTIKYMIEEQQEELDALQTKLQEKQNELREKQRELTDSKEKLERQAEFLAKKDGRIAELEAELAKLR
ncbi:MAG: PD-(D/E)XK nuclease family transposase [Lachnospiraceae bacterium]